MKTFIRASAAIIALTLAATVDAKEKTQARFPFEEISLVTKEGEVDRVVAVNRERILAHDGKHHRRERPTKALLEELEVALGAALGEDPLAQKDRFETQHCARKHTRALSVTTRGTRFDVHDAPCTLGARAEPLLRRLDELAAATLTRKEVELCIKTFGREGEVSSVETVTLSSSGQVHATENDGSRVSYDVRADATADELERLEYALTLEEPDTVGGGNVGPGPRPPQTSVTYGGTLVYGERRERVEGVLVEIRDRLVREKAVFRPATELTTRQVKLTRRTLRDGRVERLRVSVIEGGQAVASREVDGASLRGFVEGRATNDELGRLNQLLATAKPDRSGESFEPPVGASRPSSTWEGVWWDEEKGGTGTPEQLRAMKLDRLAALLREIGERLLRESGDDTFARREPAVTPGATPIDTPAPEPTSKAPTSKAPTSKAPTTKTPTSKAPAAPKPPTVGLSGALGGAR